MCVNDLIVQGAEPLLFLDYFATGKLSVDQGRAIIAGIAEGCRQSGAALIGGETAEMPGMYGDGDYDLAGFAVGAVERDRLITGRQIAAGDAVIGLGSSGVHSNGFSLVRKVIELQGLALADAAPFQPGVSLGEALLTPTRIYVKACLAAFQAARVRGLVHITGGGFVENIPRVLPDGLGVTLDGTAWRAPPVFGWLAGCGVAEAEMARVFNCGIGMAVIVPQSDVDAALAAFRGHGETAQVIGTVRAEQPGVPRVDVRDLGAALSAPSSAAAR